MTLSFKYRDVPRANETRAISPSIPIILSNGGTRFELIALVDSGADVSAIPRRTAELLGLNLAGELEKAFGIGGSVPAIQSSMTVEIGKPHERYVLRVPVKVVMNDQDFSPLLGRAGFFDEFIITFDSRQKKVVLKRR